MDLIDTLFTVAIILFSVIVHEVMHGVVADRLGDPTARYAGRLTLNPIPHIDPLGSIIVPFLSSFGGFFFGWAKPVPYNPYNFTRMRISGEAIVAAAGPLSNLAIAILFGLLIRFGVPPDLFLIFLKIVAINCSLAILNFIPIPPLDGSKVLASVLPQPLKDGYDTLRMHIERNPFLGFGLILVLIYAFSPRFGTAVYWLSRLIAGV